jgi:hypothetical protein
MEKEGLREEEKNRDTRRTMRRESKMNSPY